jgi:hypothetical protein
MYATQFELAAVAVRHWPVLVYFINLPHILWRQLLSDKGLPLSVALVAMLVGQLQTVPVKSTVGHPPKALVAKHVCPVGLVPPLLVMLMAQFSTFGGKAFVYRLRSMCAPG